MGHHHHHHSGHGGSSKTTSFRPQKLPIDASQLALKNDACHCVADAELENRYNLLRAEEHARTEGKCGPEWSTDVGSRPENADRNRYKTVMPWNHSRVLLPVEEGENDYINASWVQMGSRTYIATQGPLPSTIHDFWQMVYAYGGEPAVVIMLTPLHEHLVEKCAKYWPDSKHHPIYLKQERGFRFGLTVVMNCSHNRDQYRYSSFTLIPTDKSMPERTVHHVYYHSWLDYSKPSADADLRSLIHLVNNKLRNRASPPIVHCSAGIGRTGTFIALDALLTRIDTDILPVVVPRYIPVWRGPQHIIQYRRSVFTGAEDMHVESDSGSPLLSKFDITQASGAPSIISRPHTTKTHEMVNEFEAGSSTMRRQPVPQVSEIPSLLSERIEGNKASNESFSATTGVSDFPGSACRCDGDAAGAGAENADEVEDEDEEDEEELDDDFMPTKNGHSHTPPKKSSALSGPQIRKVAASITSVAPEVFSQTPEKVDVMSWYDPRDPVMSAIRTMRQQRPKMVQGKQQLGYVYDQFEVGQQLARATHQPNQILRRRSTVTSVASSPHVVEESRHKKTQRILSLVGLRSSSSSSSSSTTTKDELKSTTTKKKGLFSGTVLR